MSSGSETPLTLKDNFSSNAIEVAQLAMGESFQRFVTKLFAPERSFLEAVFDAIDDILDRVYSM